MVFSKDSKSVGPKKNPDADSYKAKVRKRIIFLRHGESDWNNVFNNGFNLRMVKSLFTSLIWEFKPYATVNSVFIDSSLNEESIEQAVGFSKFLVPSSCSLSASRSY